MNWFFQPIPAAGQSTVLRLIPDADVSDGGWTNEAGGSVLFSSIDEAVVDDADYIISSVNPVNDIARISISDPSSGVGEPVIVRYRYKKIGDTTPTDLIVRLFQGASEVVEWTHSGISTSFVTAEQTLTTPEFEAITDFDDLFLEFEADT